MSSAAPSPKSDRVPAQPAKIAASGGKVIVEKGSGCGQEIAGGGGGRHRSVAKRSAPGGAPAPAPMDMADEAAPATTVAPSRPVAPSPKTGARPPMQQQSAGVKAGEWDDNANYRDYAKWLAESPHRGALDIRDRQFLVVTDAAGKAVPNCTIALSGNQARTSLVTMASGRAIFFPHAMALGGEVTATAQCLGRSVSAKIDPKATDGVVQLKLDTARQLPAKQTIELAFVLDTTGSMAEEIAAVKQTIQTVADQLKTAQTDVRIGLVEYKDRSDCILTRTFAFTSDLAAISRDVAGLSADGGGDLPEDMHAGLAAAIDKLQWSPSSVARMVVVIADAPPQMYAQQKHYDDAAKRAAKRGIKLYTVAASGMDERGQVAMRQMAQFTGATNLFVLRGGAGPQAVGGGFPPSSGRGTHHA
jgi:Mg-chelatase subunit ChlD